MSNEKKLFNTGYTSAPVFFPDELCIVGGRDHIKDEKERGPLDTPTPKDDDPLFRPHRLAQGFKPGFVESIDAEGVSQDISIVSRDNVPVVEYGQMRTRGARLVNALRRLKCGVSPKLSDREADKKCAEAGFPLVRLRCSGKRYTDATRSLARIMQENNLRHDDTLETQLDQLALMLDKTEGDFTVAANSLGITVVHAKNLARYRERASKETKAAVKAGRIGIVAAAKLASVEDHDEQNKLLAQLLAAPDGATVRNTRRIIPRQRKSKVGANPFALKKELVKFRDVALKEIADGDEFMRGVREMVMLQTTGATQDERLAKLLKDYEGK